MKTKLKVWLAAAVACVALGSGNAKAFDFDHDLVPFQVGPTVLPTIFAIGQNGMDATIVIRSTMFFSTAWFDATSPYTPHGVGLFSTIPNRPLPEHTQRNQNIAAFYASFHAAMSLWPAQETEWRNMLLDVGLDPDDDSEDLTTPIGIGNVAGKALVEAYEHDGMNQLGDENGRSDYFRRPYEDTTGYEPVNTSHRLNDPSRWQPLQTTRGNGLFTSQEFVTPQYARTQAFGFDDVSVFRIPAPVKSDYRRNRRGYREQAEQVLAAQRNLTDEQKMLTELFANKVLGLGQSTAIQSFLRGLNMRQIIELDMITHAAAWDAGIITWKEKARFDAVRPITAIHFLYGDQTIRAWGGPGKGNVDMPGKVWEGYLATPDHPEYPSGSTAFCAAHAQAMRRYFGDDNFGWTLNFPAGSSIIEPGVTPAHDTSVTIHTWTEFETICGNTRVWAGSHFPDAVNNVKAVARQAGDLAADYVLAHIDGSIVGNDDDDDDCDHGHGHGGGHGHGHGH